MVVAVPTPEVLAGVGARLRHLRRARGLTLVELARETGLDASTLSRLETGRLRPTLEQLLPLARTHGVTLDEVVDAPRTGDPRIHLRPVRRFGLTFLPLTTRAGGLQSFTVIHPPRPRPPTPRPRAHTGYEWCYVLSGRIRLVLGDRDLELGPGEAAEFDTRVPHWTGNVRDHPAELLMLIGPEGERAHMATSARRPAATGADAPLPGVVPRRAGPGSAQCDADRQQRW